MPSLHLWTRAAAGTVDITVVGPLTACTLARLETCLAPHANAAVRLHLHNCTSIDRDGLFGLRLAHIEAGEAGGNLQLVDVPPLIALYLRDHRSSHLLRESSRRPSRDQSGER